MAQGHSVSGVVIDARSHEPLPGASVLLQSIADSAKQGTVTDTGGHFIFTTVSPGKYHLHISYMGFDTYKEMLHVVDGDVGLGKIYLRPSDNTLNEVKIVEKILAVTQKDDTTEFNAGAYKTNPDADAADLVKKMPGVELNGKEVKAQGETVTKVLIDGKPFFGNDPYASLKNLPAEIIARVQVYNEKSEQEQFTSFNEGKTTKTINIITRADKRNGTFGKATAGYGNDDAHSQDRYSLGGNINSFAGSRRISVTALSNNINMQNFTDQDLTGIQGGGGAGINKINSGGINYSDNWGKKIDVAASYFFNEGNNISEQQTRRKYVLASDSGQVYNEISNNENKNYNHRFNLRLNYTIDSLNSILIMPQLSLQRNYANTQLIANTQQGDTQLNAMANRNSSNTLGYNFSNNLLYRHKFHTPRRTFSLSVNTSDNHTNGASYLNSQNIFNTDTTLNTKLNQRAMSYQNTWMLSGNMTYTEPVGKKGMVQLQYDMNDQPGRSERNAYDFSDVTNAYSQLDTTLSNTFSSRDRQQKAGGSYQYYTKRYNFSFGLYYQYTTLYNKQELPYSNELDRNFGNVLPVATFQYRLSDRQNIYVNYSTNTMAPGVTQLQDVINNSNPLHLSTGNPGLKQPYMHNLMARYYITNTARRTNLSFLLTGSYTHDYITSNTIIAESDTQLRQNIILPKGSQLSMPVNIQGSWNVRSNVSYGLPLSFIKCNLNININAAIMQVPGIINNETNYNRNNSGGVGITLSSNISNHLDFTISSNTSMNSSINSLNENLNNTYVNQASTLILNWIFWKGFLLNTNVSYQHNSGLSAGFDQDYALWNISIGKKLFKKQQGDIRLTVYDVLSQNNSIQHTVTEMYIADIQTNMLQRYYMLTFSYKLRQFGK